MKAVLGGTPYRRLWLNSLFNSVSYGGDFVLIGWSILELTGTSAWVGTAFALYFLPMVFSPSCFRCGIRTSLACLPSP